MSCVWETQRRSSARRRAARYCITPSAMTLASANANAIATFCSSDDFIRAESFFELFKFCLVNKVLAYNVESGTARLILNSFVLGDETTVLHSKAEDQSRAVAKAPLNVLQFADTELFPRELERSESRIARVASGEEPTDNLQGTGDNLRAPIPIPDRVLCCITYDFMSF